MEHHKYQKVLQAVWSFVFWFSFSLEKYTFLQKMSFVFCFFFSFSTAFYNTDKLKKSNSDTKLLVPKPVTAVFFGLH